MDYTEKRVTEREIISVDFTDDLAIGETILSAVWTCSVKIGTDPAANAMISGTATIVGPIVSTLLIDGLAGVHYYPICTITTSLGQRLVLPDPGQGAIEVVA